MWVVGMIGGVLGVAVLVAVAVCIYCYVRYVRAKAAAAPPPMVEVQVLGTIVSETSSTAWASETSSAAATAWASEGTVESGPLQGFPVPSAPSAEEMPAAAPLRNWEMPPPAPPRNFCSACGAPVQGPFCGQCGTRA